MLLPPEPQEEFGVDAGERVPAMNGDVAATAQGDVERRAVVAGLPVMHEQARPRQTQLAAAITVQDPFALPGKKPHGMPSAVVAGAAQAVSEERFTPASAAPEGGLQPRESGCGMERERGTHASLYIVLIDISTIYRCSIPHDSAQL